MTPGGLFLALPGARADGHDFAAAAVAAGAVAVLAARPVGVPAIVVDPVGPDPAAVGTASVLEHDARRLGRRGAGRAGAAGRRGGRRTRRGRADDRRHHRLVGQDLDQGPDRRGAGAAGRGRRPARVVQQRTRPSVDGAAGRREPPTSWCWRCRRATPATSPRWPRIAPPSIAVVLNVGTAHLGEFGSREAIAATKAELPQAVPESGVVILNADDPVGGRDGRQDRGAGGAGRPRRRRTRRLGRRRHARRRWPGRASRCTPAPARSPVTLAVHGDHQVSNALCAAAVALECGATLEQVAAALAGAGPASRHRMQVSTRADGVTVINDAYNANPDSMRAGLQGAGLDGPSRRRTRAPQLGRAGGDGRARRRRDYRARPHRHGWRCD